MGKTTSITWTDHTWNPWIGCTKVSEGCRNCYMYRDAKRYGFDPTSLRVTKEGTFTSPMRWDSGRVFVCSWSDFFHPDVPLDVFDRAWNIMRLCKHLTFQLCTKRAGDIVSGLPDDWGNGWPNVWIGVTVEDQKSAYRIGAMDEFPAAVKFVSYEPALEAIDIEMYTPVFQWLISGGESGPGARPANPDWFRTVRDMCKQYNIAYFHKQNGGTTKSDGVWGGDKIDGIQHHEFPSSVIG